MTEATELRAIVHFDQQRAERRHKHHTLRQFQRSEKSQCIESKDTAIFTYTKGAVLPEVKEEMC